MRRLNSQHKALWRARQLRYLTPTVITDWKIHPACDRTLLRGALASLPAGTPSLKEEGWYVLTRIIRPEAYSGDKTILPRAAGLYARSFSWPRTLELLDCGRPPEAGQPPNRWEFGQVVGAYFEFFFDAALTHTASQGNVDRELRSEPTPHDMAVSALAHEILFEGIDLSSLLNIVSLWKSRVDEIIQELAVPEPRQAYASPNVQKVAISDFWRMDTISKDRWEGCLPGITASPRHRLLSAIAAAKKYLKGVRFDPPRRPRKPYPRILHSPFERET